MDSLKLLRDHFAASGNLPPHGATVSDVNAFEQKYAVKIPNDMRTYFLELNGNGGGMTGLMYAFSSLSELRKASDWGEGEITSPTCFVFADFAIDCWAYAIEMGSSDDGLNRIHLLGGRQAQVVAKSFTDFVSIYLTAPEKLDPR